jgi:hypothetical protein
MRYLALAVLLVPFAADANTGNRTSGGFGDKKINIKEEVLEKCGSFPYAPTIVVDAQTATIDEMKNTRDSVQIFLKQVSNYETCMITLGKTLDGKMSEQDGDYVIKQINRALDERDVLAVDFNKLVDDYNDANGIKPAEKKPAASTTKPATP